MKPSVERPRPSYLKPDLEAHPALNRRIYRYDTGNKRWYCAVDSEQPQWAVSVTSLISATRPTPEHLIAWRANLGNDQYRASMDERSAYGTWMHTLWSRALITGSICVDADYLTSVMHTCPAGYEDQWVADAQNDLLSLAAWAAERQPEVLAIEPVMIHQQDGFYGGAIDLVCIIDWQGKRTVAIVDFKSGRKGFYESHEIQLHAYMSIWNSYFAGTEYEVTHVFNLAPTDWRRKPTYKFEHQSDKPSKNVLPHLLDIYKADPFCLMEPPAYKRYGGSYTMGEPVEAAAEEVSPYDIIKQRIGG